MMWKWNGEDILNPNYATWQGRKKGKMSLNDLIPGKDQYTVKKNNIRNRGLPDVL